MLKRNPEIISIINRVYVLSVKKLNLGGLNIMDFSWEFLSICYGVVAGLLYTIVYWIEVVLGKVIKEILCAFHSIKRNSRTYRETYPFKNSKIMSKELLRQNFTRKYFQVHFIYKSSLLLSYHISAYIEHLLR